ncbi:FUN14 family-containing protein [Aphelenchoides bicaudatus]|nr:FUN14 family-containing protein [Aphelenchoides bicaudatus]
MDNDIVKSFTNKINGQRNNSVMTSLDNFLRYLRTIETKPVPIQIGVGATGGFLSSYFLTRISKFFAGVAGVSLILFQFLNYRGYIKFRQNQLQRDLSQLADQINGSGDLVPTTVQVEGFLSKNTYLLGGFVGGSMIGYSFA